MKLFRNYLITLFIFSTSTFAGSSQTLRLSSIVRPNINIYFDKADGLRIISNSYFKKKIKPYKYGSAVKNFRSKTKYKLVEISMN